MSNTLKCCFCSTYHQTSRLDQHCLEQLKRQGRYFQYRYQIYAPDHPLASQSRTTKGYVNIARHIVSIRRGTWIQSGEVVRFADGDVGNFSGDNLLVVTRASLVRLRSQRVNLNCAVCNAPFTENPSHAPRRSTCSVECRAALSQKFDVTADELLVAVWEQSTIQVAKMFGVSDKAIEKRCKKLGVMKPPRGYWRLIEVGVSHEDALKRMKWTDDQIVCLDEMLARAENAQKRTLDSIAVFGDKTQKI